MKQSREVYQLVGYFNMLQFHPDFLYPVFEKDGNLYLQREFDEDLSILTFQKLHPYTLPRVTILTDGEIKKSVTNEEFIYRQIGSSSVQAFGSDHNHVCFGDYHEILDCALEYKKHEVTIEPVLKERIKTYQKETEEIDQGLKKVKRLVKE